MGRPRGFVRSGTGEAGVADPHGPPMRGYVVKHVPSSKFLPANYARAGATLAELTSVGLPRLYPNEQSAWRSIREWGRVNDPQGLTVVEVEIWI